MKRIILLASLCACATNEANLGTTEHETPRWAIGLGDRGYESTTAVAFDSLGDVVVAGQGHLWPADLGNGTIGSYEDWGFLTKRVASDGASRWSIAFPGYGQYAGAFINALAVGADDSIFIGGSYNGTVHFGDHDLAGGNAFIAKYSTDGVIQWIWTPDTPGSLTIAQLTLDPSGNIVVVGQYGGMAFDFLGQHHDALPNGNGFVVSFDPNGAPQWSRFFADVDGTRIDSLAVMSAGDVVVSGEFAGSSSFGGAVLDANAHSRGFLARYRNDGLYLWSHAFGIDDGQTGDTRIAIVHDDHIALTDVEILDADWRHNTVRISELDADGTPVWTSSQQYSESVRSDSLAVRPDGDLVSARWQEIEGGPDIINGHVQITTFDLRGHITQGAVGSRVVPDYRGTASVSSAIGPHGELGVVGEFSGSIDLGFGPLVTHGTDDTDAFVLVVEPPTD